MAERKVQAPIRSSSSESRHAVNQGISNALGPDLLWRALYRRPYADPCAALFLDRDGVIIEECHYLADPARVVLLPGIPDLVTAARSRGYAIVGVTNQAGIGRGIFGWSEFAAVEARVAAVLAEQACYMDAVFACPYHPEGRYPYNIPHPWRKPGPGMLTEAAERLNLDLSVSLLVGDKASDILAARAAGLPLAIHVLTGHGGEEKNRSLGASTAEFKVFVAESVGAVTELVPEK